jgi:tRNA (mo5U34)-methyltransferase
LHFTGTIDQDEFDSRCRELPWWYHSYYFDNGFVVRGDYDIAADVADYGFPESMEGMRVLDIGTGAGWFAFYFERRGADVVTVDARGYCDFDVYGRHAYPPFEAEKRSPDRIGENGEEIYFSPVSRGFWTMKDILGSRVRFRNARVYDIGPGMFNGEKFDLVFLGAILCHLRDPIGALMAARSVCRHRVIASTPVVLGETEPDVLPRQYLPYTNQDKISWWLPNEACFRHWFLAAGLTGVDVSRQVTLRSDIVRVENGKPANGDQTLRVGSGFVP